MPDELLKRSRDYAEKHGTTLHGMVRSLLKKTIQIESSNIEEKINASMPKMGVDTKSYSFNREELYER